MTLESIKLPIYTSSRYLLCVTLEAGFVLDKSLLWRCGFAWFFESRCIASSQLRNVNTSSSWQKYQSIFAIALWHVRWWQLQNAVEWGSMEVFAKRQGNVLWMGVCRCSLWLWSRFGKCFARLSWRPESCAKRRFIDQKITGFHLTLADNSCKFWLKLMSGNSLWISISSVIALFRFSVLRKKSD